MLENRRYKRYDVSKEKIAVRIHDVTGFSFVGYLSDISKGGFRFKTSANLRWKHDEIVTVYLQLPNQSKLTPMNVRPVRSDKKLFSAFHAGEFIGSIVETDSISPLLTMKEEANLVETV